MKLVSVILAAGKGTRMRSDTPKVLHPVLGVPLLEHVLRASARLGGADSRQAVTRTAVSRQVVVVGHGRDEIQAKFAESEKPVIWAVQEEQLGTAHAAAVGVEALRSELDAHPDTAVLVLNGDLPLLTTSTLENLCALYEREEADVGVLSCLADNPYGYGRIVRDPAGTFQAIVEERDADDQTRQLKEINVGTYVFRASVFRSYVEQIDRANAQGELYLTDVVGKAAAAGKKVVTHCTEDEEEIAQVSCRSDMARVSQILRGRLLAEHMESGVSVVDPLTTYIEVDVKIGQDTTIHPFTHIERGVEIAPRCQVGPFCHLRPGTSLASGVKVGNFVEIKQSQIGEDTKVPHLSYVGDGTVGKKVNIGAGTVFANYDGKTKSKTTIKDGAFVGSGTVLVAPLTIGEGAVTGAGAVVLRDHNVANGEVVVGVPARTLRKS